MQEQLRSLDSMPGNLIGAVSPRQLTLMPKAKKVDWKAAKVPFSNIPVPGGSPTPDFGLPRHASPALHEDPRSSNPSPNEMVIYHHSPFVLLIHDRSLTCVTGMSLQR